MEGGKRYPFFNEYQNEIILFITMNFLSNTVTIGNQKSSNPKSLQAVEKVFLYITSDIKDCFIESIKQITSTDLRYFSKLDVVSPEIRNTCDDYSSAFRTLLELMGLGCFSRQDMKIIKNLSIHTSFDKCLSSYVTKDCGLTDIINNILNEMRPRFKD